MAESVDALEELDWRVRRWTAQPDENTMYVVSLSDADGLYYAMRLNATDPEEWYIEVATEHLGKHEDLEVAKTVCRDDFRWRQL